MTRLPPRLQPLWPVVKRGHRLGARVLGAVGRHAGGPSRGLPRMGTTTSLETAAAEPASVRRHVVGAPFVVRRRPPAGDPPGHWFFGRRLDHPVPEQFVLELTDGLLLGRHAAVVTAGGRLDMETSHYFDIGGWREHPVFWNPWPRKEEYVDGTVAVLSARGSDRNYFHFLIDALPRLGMLEQAFPGLWPDVWVVDDHTRYQRELVTRLGLADRARIVEPAPGLALRARRLLVPSLPNASTLVAPGTTEWLRTHLPPRDTAGRPERIYVTRGRTENTRRVVHEEELLDRLRGRGFVCIDPGSMPVQDQIDHFAAARVIVAPHGAALTNLSFCRPGVRVLELFAAGYLNGGYWSIVNEIPDARYRYLVADHPAHRRPRPPAPGDADEPRQTGVMQDIHATPEQVVEALDALLGTP